MASGPVAILIALGGILLLGLAADAAGRRTPLPRVTLLLILGIAVGPSGLDLLPFNEEQWFEVAADVALVMVGFLLGGKFTLASLRQYGRLVIYFSVAEVLATALVIIAGMILLRTPVPLALLLAGVATATDPAATADVVRESDADGPFARVLLGIVAIDDAWGLILFSVLLAAASLFTGDAASTTAVLVGLRDLGGAMLLGVVLGVPAAYLTGRIDPGEPTLTEALGIVLLCGGLAIWLDVSFLLASMVLGAVVANLAKHHSRPFHAIEGIEWPFMVLFFLLAGASLKPQRLATVGSIGALYVLLRVIGRLIGGWVAGRASGADRQLSRWMGLGLMSQAGVALGMALLVNSRFPDLGQTVLSIVIGSTVIFELAGPVCTRVALNRVGESRQSRLQAG